MKYSIAEKINLCLNLQSDYVLKTVLILAETKETLPGFTDIKDKIALDKLKKNNTKLTPAGKGLIANSVKTLVELGLIIKTEQTKKKYDHITPNSYPLVYQPVLTLAEYKSIKNQNSLGGL